MRSRSFSFISPFATPPLGPRRGRCKQRPSATGLSFQLDVENGSLPSHRRRVSTRRNAVTQKNLRPIAHHDLLRR